MQEMIPKEPPIRPTRFDPSAISAGARRYILKGRGGSMGRSIGTGSARGAGSAGGWYWVRL